MISVEESDWVGALQWLILVNGVGPASVPLGINGQCQRFLPANMRGDVYFSIGYTEPVPGTELASFQTRAVRDGEEYVINANKRYTGAIQLADYAWLAARTYPDAPKHKGLSVFIVPVQASGCGWTPLATMAAEFTSSTFYANVRVPTVNLVGGQNVGWTLITNRLNFERIAS